MERKMSLHSVRSWQRLGAALLTVIIFIVLPLAARAAVFVTPGEMGTGALLFKSREEGKYVEAPRVASDFDITVTGPIARTRVTQAFTNPTDGWVEGVYVFPLPDNSAVDTLKMVIGSRVIVGDIKEKREAKHIYEEAKAKGEKAALLEEERPNIFTNQVANIGPGETIVVQIEYQEAIRQSGGVFSLRVPLVVGPRYNPPAQIEMSGETNQVLVSDSVPDRQRIEPPVLDSRKHVPVNPVTLTVHLNPGFVVGEVKSAFHNVDIAAPSPDREVIMLADPEFANRDFELTWQPKPGTEPGIGLFSERVGNDDYALAFVTPPAALTRAPREVIFVIDNSGSMGGQSIAQAKASLLYALDRLDPADRFNVIRFDDTMDIFFPDVVPADREHVTAAKTLVSNLEANGGTEMIPPLKAALNDATPDAKDTLRQVIFLTDGAIGNEQEMFDVLTRTRGRSRVFMVGIGSAPNSYLMTRAAELGRGTFTQIGSAEQVEERMRELFAKLESPIVTDMKASFDAAEVEVTPELLPDVYRGEPVMLLMKMPARKGKLTLTGKIAGADWTSSVLLDAAQQGSGVDKLWARRKIDSAEVAMTLGQVSPELTDHRILTLALQHDLVSRMTSLVAVDKTPARQPNEKLTRADIPLNLPVGWDYDKVFGEQPKAGERDVSLDATLIAMSKVPSKAANQEALHTVDLPEGGTYSALLILLGSLFCGLSLGLLVLSHRARPA
jgi:Ca-activated chloride channel family protein